MNNLDLVLLKLITCTFCNPIRTVFCLIENQKFVKSVGPITYNVKSKNFETNLL